MKFSSFPSLGSLYPSGYNYPIIEIRKTEHFARWLDKLIDVGPGYRVYYVQRERVLIILLVGGDKSTQARDIKTAFRLARNL